MRACATRSTLKCRCDLCPATVADLRRLHHGCQSRHRCCRRWLACQTLRAQKSRSGCLIAAAACSCRKALRRCQSCRCHCGLSLKKLHPSLRSSMRRGLACRLHRGQRACRASPDSEIVVLLVLMNEIRAEKFGRYKRLASNPCGWESLMPAR